MPQTLILALLFLSYNNVPRVFIAQNDEETEMKKREKTNEMSNRFDEQEASSTKTPPSASHPS